LFLNKIKHISQIIRPKALRTWCWTLHHLMS